MYRSVRGVFLSSERREAEMTSFCMKCNYNSGIPRAEEKLVRTFKVISQWLWMSVRPSGKKVPLYQDEIINGGIALLLKGNNPLGSDF